MARTQFHPDQGNLFDDAVFPSRQASPVLDGDGMANKLARAMSRALRECGKSRGAVALEMGQVLGTDPVPVSTLNSYTSESKADHQISVLRFRAFVRVTGAVWLWDLLVADEGLTVLDGDEARLAEIALHEQQIREIQSHVRKMRRQPVTVREGVRV
ncbi:MAG: hypothetical protein AAF903_12150 [Pseudomonadota bacterium]